METAGFHRPVNDFVYRLVRLVGRPIFALASRSMVLHRERASLTGPVLLAMNHLSVFDPALVVAVTPRVIHFLSTVQTFQPSAGRTFLRAFGVLLLDGTRPDPAGIRALRQTLQAGGMVGVFPEGGIREEPDSVLNGAPLPDAIARLAQLTRVPVLPCVVVGVRRFSCWTSWLPFRRTRWAVAFGELLTLHRTGNAAADRAVLLEQLREAMLALAKEVEAWN